MQRKRVISDGEIASLAERARLAWESGLNMAATDSLGGLWSFNVVRDDHMRLEVERTSGPADELVHAGAHFSGAEMGASDNLAALLASRISRGGGDMNELGAIRLQALAQELVRRDWFVTAVEATDSTVIIGFNFMPQRRPSWLKAFELPLADATPQAVEARIETWKARVRERLANGQASETVRRMLAEHGPEAVREAMRARLPAQ